MMLFQRSGLKIHSRKGIKWSAARSARALHEIVAAKREFRFTVKPVPYKCVKGAIAVTI